MVQNAPLNKNFQWIGAETCKEHTKTSPKKQTNNGCFFGLAVVICTNGNTPIHVLI